MNFKYNGQDGSENRKPNPKNCNKLFKLFRENYEKKNGFRVQHFQYNGYIKLCQQSNLFQIVYNYFLLNDMQTSR